MVKTDVKELEQLINDCTNSLAKMVQESCWNRFSKDYCYILTKIGEHKGGNFFEQNKDRKRKNSLKQPITSAEMASKLLLIYEDIYELNFYVYQSLSYKTIIEVAYYPKSSHNKDYFEEVKNNKPLVHCKLPIPNYAGGIDDEKKKFDVNWQLGGLIFQWNIFLYRIKYKLGVNSRRLKSILKK